MAKKTISNLIRLTEYETTYLPLEQLPLAPGEMLWREFDRRGKKLQIDFPSPKTNHRWAITPQGWVGHIPLTSATALMIQPKVPLQNLFHMWEYAYKLKGVALLSGLTELQSLAQFYEHVTYILAKGVLRRGHKGFHHDYISQSGQVSYIRGKVLLHNVWNSEQHYRPYCQYESHTADIPDNQILAYTLGQIARTRRCRPQIQTAVRRAYHLLQNITTPLPFSSQDCHGRHYTRLNQDYRPLHALCRFLLEHQSPGVQRGAYEMMPFLMNMARLYELFVAEWLQSHLPPPWHVKAQETVTVGVDNELRFDIDLVLYDGQGEVHAVLDTKYKVPHKINRADINQIVTYAKAKRCHQAILIYPAPLTKPLDVHLEDLRLRSLAFVLDGDLEASGEAFLAALLPL